MTKKLTTLLLAVFFFSSFAQAEVMRVDYTGFTIWLDCDQRAAVKFRYNAQRDTGNAKRKGSFYYDDNLPEHCQQLSRSSYRGKQLTGRYDRGHLVPANHMDSDPRSIRDSNYMTNIVPQAANANRGAWLLTEEIIECHRDKEELLVIGGVIWGNNPKDDYFLSTHGIKTPDALWKAVLKGLPGKEQVIAWVVPNTNDAKRRMLDRYLVSVAEIERITGQRINEIPASVKSVKLARSWDVPKGCDKG